MRCSRHDTIVRDGICEQCVGELTFCEKHNVHYTDYCVPCSRSEENV